MGAGHGQKIVSRSCTAGTASKFNTQEYAAKKFSHCQSWRKREQDENKTCRSAGCRRSSTLPPKGRLRFGLRGRLVFALQRRVSKSKREMAYHSAYYDNKPLTQSPEPPNAPNSKRQSLQNPKPLQSPRHW